MRTCLPGVQTEVRPQGNGSALCLVVTQDAADIGGWKLAVYALFTDSVASRVFLDTVTLSAVGALRATRIVAMCTIPGSYGYEVTVSGPSPTTNPKPIDVGVFCGVMTAFPFTTVHP
jgi:hypothetical protein